MDKREPVLLTLPLDLIIPGNPRQEYNVEALADLADRIREGGVFQPLVVVPDVPPDHGLWYQYRLVSGERWWRAAQLAGVRDVPAVSCWLTPEQEALAMDLDTAAWQAAEAQWKRDNPPEEEEGEDLNGRENHAASVLPQT